MSILTLLWTVGSSWLLFCVYRLHTILALMIVFVIGLLLFVFWIMSRLTKHSFQLPISRRIAVACWLVGIVLAVLAPLYSYMSGVRILNEMVEVLGIPVERIDVDVQLLDTIGDLGPPRFVRGDYILRIPTDAAKQQVLSVLNPRPGWGIADDPKDEDFAMYAGCDSTMGGPIIDVVMRTEGTLFLLAPRAAPDYCYLRQSR
jgi:hypothetical protein